MTYKPQAISFKPQARSLKLVACSLVSGVLSGLSFNYPGLSFLIWFSLIPLLFVIKAVSYKQAFLYSYLTGFIFFLTTVFWVHFVSKLGLFFLVFYLAFWWALFALLAKKFISSARSPLLVSFAWIILEYLRTTFGGFGWALLGYSQYKFSILIQSAALFGAWAVSFLIVYFNVFLFNLISKIDKAVLRKQVVFMIILFSLVLAYGLFSWSPSYLSNSLGVSIIQPNIPQYKKWNPAYYEEIIQTLLRLVNQTPQDSLVILPEAAWPYSLGPQNFSAILDFAKACQRDILIGVVEEDRDIFYNSTFLFSKDVGLVDKYRKINLVPFGEFMPFRDFLGFIEVIGAFGDITPGSRYVVFGYKDFHLASLICFEDIFPKLVSRFVSGGADILVNITNDAWFRGHPQARQHLQSAVFRAIEQRRFLVRAANTGVSCVISPRGRIVSRLAAGSKDVFVEGVLTGEVAPVEKRSVYNRIGDVLIYLGLAVCLLGLRVKQENV